MLWLIHKSIKALEIKILIVFTLAFTGNTISSCFFLFFLIIDLYFLIPAMIAQIFNPIAYKEPIPKPRNTYKEPTNEANAETETQLLTEKMKTIKFPT